MTEYVVKELLKSKTDLENLKECFDVIGVEYVFDNQNQNDFACLAQYETVEKGKRLIKFYYFRQDGSYIKEVTEND